MAKQRLQSSLNMEALLFSVLLASLATALVLPEQGAEAKPSHLSAAKLNSNMTEPGTRLCADCVMLR
jgi:hypothetical protein